MKLFLDSAILGEIEFAYKTGLCDGITMNPSLVKKAVDSMKEKGEKAGLKDYIKKALRIAEGTPVSLEVTELDTKGMVEQGKKIFKEFNPVANNIYIKIPVNPSFPNEDGKEFDGVMAIKQLRKANIPVNCTLIFTPEQALAAAARQAHVADDVFQDHDGVIDDDADRQRKPQKRERIQGKSHEIENQE